MFPNGSVAHVATASPWAEESHDAGSIVPFAGDMKGAIGSGLLAIGRRFRFFGKAENQLLRLNLNARDPGTNDDAVVNRLGRFEVLPNGFDN